MFGCHVGRLLPASCALCLLLLQPLISHPWRLFASELCDRLSSPATCDQLAARGCAALVPGNAEYFATHAMDYLLPLCLDAVSTSRMQRCWPSDGCSLLPLLRRSIRAG